MTSPFGLKEIQGDERGFKGVGTLSWDRFSVLRSGFDLPEGIGPMWERFVSQSLSLSQSCTI